MMKSPQCPISWLTTVGSRVRLKQEVSQTLNAGRRDPLAVIQKGTFVLVLPRFMKQSHRRRPDYDLIPI